MARYCHDPEVVGDRIAWTVGGFGKRSARFGQLLTEVAAQLDGHPEHELYELVQSALVELPRSAACPECSDSPPPGFTCNACGAAVA